MLRRVAGINEVPADKIPHEQCERTPRVPHHAAGADSSLCRGVWTQVQKGCFGYVDVRQRQNSPAEEGRLTLRQTQAAFVISLAITWAVSVCRTIARALLICCFPVLPPHFLHIPPWVGVSVGGLLSLFAIGSPSSLLLFIITAVLEVALLICPDFWIFLVFTFPLLHPLSVFCSTAVIAAARALRLLTLLTFTFLLFLLLLLLSRGFLWLFWWGCFGLGLLCFVTFNLCSWIFFTGERRK